MTPLQAAVDASQAHAATWHEDEFVHPRLVLLATTLASSLAFVDGSVVNVGLPSIGRDLHAGAADLQWVINGYLLPLSALLLLGGALGDRFGRRRLLVFGTVLFAVASAAAALAPSLPWLLFARSLQGTGAALLMPNSLAILGSAFSGEAKGRAIGIWAAAGSMTSAVGPVMGGLLIDAVGWRSIFLVNLPLASGAIWLAWRYVSNRREAVGGQPLDLWGAACATLALGALTWGLTIGSGSQGWRPSAVISVTAGACLLAGFLCLESRAGQSAMMPLSLFASRSFVGLSTLTILLWCAWRAARHASLRADPGRRLLCDCRWRGRAASAARPDRRIPHGRRPCRPSRAAMAFDPWPNSDGGRLAPDVESERRLQLLDDNASRDARHLLGHGRRRRAPDNSRPDFGGREPHRLSFRP